MKSLKKIFLLAIVTLFLASCGSSLKVTTDYDRTVDFSQYKTFGLYNLAIEAQTISDLNKARIYGAVKTALTQRGLTESANPDIWVNCLAVVDTRESHSSTTTTSGMGMGMGGMGMMGMGGFHRPYMWGNPMMMGGTSVARTQHHVDIYQKGSLMVDVIDARTNNLVWHATGKRKVDKNFGRNADEKILKYITQLFSDFPPGVIVHTTTNVKN